MALAAGVGVSGMVVGVGSGGVALGVIFVAVGGGWVGDGAMVGAICAMVGVGSKAGFTAGASEVSGNKSERPKHVAATKQNPNPNNKVRWAALIFSRRAA